MGHPHAAMETQQGTAPTTEDTPTTEEAPSEATTAAATPAAPDAGANKKGRKRKARKAPPATEGTKAWANSLGIPLTYKKGRSGQYKSEARLRGECRKKDPDESFFTTPAGAPASAHGDRDTGADHDTGSDQATNDRENNDGSDRDVSDLVPEWSAGDAEDDAEDDGGGSMSHDSFRAPQDQKCAEPPDARGKRGLKRFAEVDISNCSVCNERLRPLGNHVASFQPCDECLDKLKEMTDAYDTACLCPKHASLC